MARVDFSYLQGPAPPQEDRGRRSRAARRFLKLVDDEIYNSEISFVDGIDALNLAFRKKGGLIPIGQYSGHTELSALRSWSHIRRKAADHFSVWFPAEGHLIVTQHGQTIEVHPDQFAVTYANEPFRVRNSRGGGQHCESYHIFVPSYIFQGFLPQIRTFCGRVFQADAGQSLVARDLFMSLFRQAGQLPDDFEMTYATMAVRASADAIRAQVGADLPPGNLAQDRLERLLRYIELNLEDADLTAAGVAHGCGISIRYLHHLMRRCGKTYQDHVRVLRLERAIRLLGNPQFDRFTITEIGYRVGLKSASHFNQAFKEQYALSPSRLRRERDLVDSAG